MSFACRHARTSRAGKPCRTVDRIQVHIAPAVGRVAQPQVVEIDASADRRFVRLRFAADAMAGAGAITAPAVMAGKARKKSRRDSIIYRSFCCQQA